jgi:hypothetical protein
MFWPETISNEHLWQMAEEKLIIQQMKEWKWKWIGHPLRKDSQATERRVLSWNLQGQRNRRRPKRTWRRTVELEKWKDLEINWSLGPKQDPLEMLPGLLMLLKE